MGGGDANFDKLTDALQKLQKGSIGKDFVGKLADDDRTVQIAMWRNGNKSDAENGTWVLWNPDKTQGNFLNEDKTNSRPSFIGLAHELAHIDEVWHGTNDQSEWFKDPINGEVVPMCEIPVCDVENKIRAEHGISPRAFYFYFVDEKKGITYQLGPLLNK